MQTGTRAQYRWLKGILVAILSLNVIDAAVTLFWVSTGRASEANPLMAPLLDGNAVVFILVKLRLVMLGVLLLWRFRRHPLAVVGITLVLLVYYGALLLHVSIFSRVDLAGWRTPARSHWTLSLVRGRVGRALGAGDSATGRSAKAVPKAAGRVSAG